MRPRSDRLLGGRTIALVDVSEAHWRRGDDGLIKKSPSGATGEIIVARFSSARGFRLKTTRVRCSWIEGRSTGFTANEATSTVFQDVRHYDGKVSLMSRDSRSSLLIDQTIRREDDGHQEERRFSIFRRQLLGAAQLWMLFARRISRSENATVKSQTTRPKESGGSGEAGAGITQRPPIALIRGVWRKSIADFRAWRPIVTPTFI